MPDPASRQAALIASAMLVGPSIPPGVVANRPAEAATALTRMADLLIPWLEGDEPPADGLRETLRKIEVRGLNRT